MSFEIPAIYPLTIFFIIFLVDQYTCQFKYDNWKFHFPSGAGMGLFVAIAVPLNLPNKNAYLAYNFEANYALPDNTTSYSYPPLVQRSIDRKFVYSALETKMNTSGYPGKACLLRTICEASSHSIQHNNGVLGDILHIIFTPSSSINAGLSPDYEEAEARGRTKNDCKVYNKNCTVSFLDLISWVGKAV